MKPSHPIHLNVPISKIDEEQRMVWGYATVEEVDAHGEIIGYEASKKAFSNWIGNIREMHKDIAVGKAIEIEYDDDKKGVWIGARISESDDGEQAWIKCKEGVLAGFSIGGKMHDYKLVNDNDVERVFITDYSLSETSLVDNPAVASATFQIVKSVDGGLQHIEKMNNKPNRQPAWWETMYKFADSQSVIKPSVLIYNKSSMDITKNIFTADEIVDLGYCLADFIYWQKWSGKDTKDLEAALKALKSAAITELKEDEKFPEPLSDAIALACKTLNITKREELTKMADEKKELAKSVVGQEDRDANAEVTVTAEENGKGPNDAAVTGAVAETVQEVKPGEDAPAETVPEPAAPAEDVTVDNKVDDEDADAAPAPKKGKKSADDADDIAKSTTNDDLVKSILAGVDGMITKAIEPLKSEIEVLKGAPAPSKAKGSYTDVEKAAEVKDAQNDVKSEFDTLNKRADELAANPNAGTPAERADVAIKLRKLSRQMDPASIAKHAAIKAQFNTNQ